MIGALTLVTPAAEPAVSLVEAKAHLRVDGGEEDALIETLVAAAAEACRAFTARELVNQAWRWTLDGFPGARLPWWQGVREGVAETEAADALHLPLAPLVSVASVVTYADDGTPATLAAGSYFVDTASVPGRIVPRAGQSWPQPTRRANAVEIVFTAGYGTRAADVPASLRHGILLLAAELYERRGPGDMAGGADVPAAVAAAWRAYRRPRLA